MSDRDAFFMRKALRLAERGRGRTSPNPMVGALVVDREGVIVGRGSHEFAGGPHAEVHAIEDAGALARGATLYCTLEPCCHVGRTGPCAPLVADAGIRRVVIATDDPNPRVAGGGSALLRGRGIEVRSGVLAAEACRLNAPFFTVMQKRRPFVTLKVALSLDGRIAAAPGVRTAITGAAANRQVHRDRAEVDAIAIGSGTVIADDPVLTCRVAYRPRPFTRVVFDSRLRTPPSARLFSTLAAGPVIIVASSDTVEAEPHKAAALRAVGATIQGESGENHLASSLERLAAGGVNSILVEGGAHLHEAFWNAGLVDRVQIYVAPRALGEAGVPWVQSAVVSSTRVHDRSAVPLGEDVLIEGYVHGTH